VAPRGHNSQPASEPVWRQIQIAQEGPRQLELAGGARNSGRRVNSWLSVGRTSR